MSNAFDPDSTPDWDKLHEGHIGWIKETPEDYAKGVSVLAILHGRDGEPEPVMVLNVRPGETVKVDFTTGDLTIVMPDRVPTLVNADTGQPFTPEEIAAAAQVSPV